MEMKYSKEFVTLAKNGNYMATAEDLFMAQSTLSKHIQSLEQALGQKLFYRNTRNVELTPFGTAYLPYAKEIVRIEEKCESELIMRWGRTSVQIHLGMHHGLRPYDVPTLIQEFQSNHGDCDIELLTSDAETLIEMVASHTCDFAILRDPYTVLNPEKATSFDIIPLYKDPFVLVVPINHPLALQDSVSYDQLKKELFLTLPENSAMHTTCINECKKYSFEPSIKVIPSCSAILDAVSAGLGIALFGKKIAKTLPSTSLKVLNTSPTSYLGIYIVSSKKHTMSYSAKQLMDYFCLKADF